MIKKIFKYFIFIIILYGIYHTALCAKKGYEFYKMVQNQEAQMEELYVNKAFLFKKVIQNKLNIDFQISQVIKNTKLLENKIEIIKQKNDELLSLSELQKKKIIKQDSEINKQKMSIIGISIRLKETKKELSMTNALNNISKKEVIKPKIDYLESVTVYILNKRTEGAYIGTGVVVKQDSFYTYIITNKHVCDKYNIDVCNIQIYKYGQLVDVPLQFVRQTESKYDLSLWKTSEYLPRKRAIKGLANIKKQDRVYSVGNYWGFENIYTEGTFAGYDNDGIFIFNLPCWRGCSGSGIYDKNGNLVSVLFASHIIGLLQQENVKMLGVPSEIIRLFLRNLI